MTNERVLGPSTCESNEVADRRFAGVARLYGEDAFKAFGQATVAVIGLGGVGSWAAEALARSAVGHLVLIDFDHIAPSNVNRQLHAIEGSFGKAKVLAMAERLQAINPMITITMHDVFAEPANLEQIIPHNSFVLDACDDVSVKVALASFCKKQKIPLVMCGGAGGKVNPRFLNADDLAKATHDPLLAKIRAELRKNHSFTKDLKLPMGIRAVYSAENMRGDGSSGLACSGYGSTVNVTASFGFLAAAEILSAIQSQTTN
ncbi:MULTISPECIES: tRNA threonylcarbamoyladenosine dehydratase [unclassified Polynucleobacter]|uniref:tRNA threonylcarbamoyladenosine dehydratase n=1 Tax=unclassified Polynucleobacter TaxID=2640945 RepID=UPI0025748532|nr:MULTISPECIES: tRNA threonylcarbamoyladenosine dehydratase [unclassified Polynucleobacter]BEI43193.1 tRNA cyclic N6-threonylcarbamoyladenosine(37) synthase TcdA [Polynucleobacter sp. HIN10]BEI44970.1 tRNA cyclic N6-threonylcarbamoyladenosine(37) synthase TcdA [Polynucleobacter sp. HIN11]